MTQILTIKDAEDKLITIALAKSNGRRDLAAVMLGISIRKLQQRLAKRRAED